MARKTGKGNKSFFVTSYVLVSLFSGVIAFVVGELLFEKLTEKLYTPIGIMLYFFIFVGILFVSLMTLLGKKLTTNDYNLKLRSIWKPFLIVMFVFLLLTTVFEFLYEIGKEEIPVLMELIKFEF